MEKLLLKRGMVVLLATLIVAGGCARFRRGGGSLLDKGPQEAITEDELDAFDISPELSSRGMTFAETSNLQDVHFGYNRSDIKPFARKILAANAEWLKRNPRVRVQIEGHCDERGTVAYNLALGQRRASSVRKYLAILGINPKRLFTISYGEEQPVDPGHNEEAWAKNRRAHFKIKTR